MRRILTVGIFLAATPLMAADITVDDAYARVSRPGAPTGAMFMTIHNAAETADRLVEARSPVAQMVELHTHIEEDGIMRMRPIDEGLEIPAGGTHQLARGGDHVMLMGLTETLENGTTVPLTLIFQNAGQVSLEVPVDNDRQQGHGMIGRGQASGN